MSTGQEERLRLLATLWDNGGTGSIRLHDRYPVAVEEVWSALTDRDRLAQWLGEFDGDLRLGGELHSRFYASGAEGSVWITECSPPTGLAILTDRETGEVIRIGLTGGGDGTRIDLEHRGLLLEWLPGYAAGTQIHLEDLAAHLDGRGRCDSEARMAELHPAYRAQPVKSSAAHHQ